MLLDAVHVPYHRMSYVSGSDVTKKKPDPEIFLIAIRRVGLEAGRCVVFEDAPSGVQAAKAAGAKCVAVTNTVPAAELAGADLICDSLERVNLETLRKLVEHHRQSRAATTLLTAIAEDPYGYGRILRDARGGLAAIVEERDATAEQRRIDEVNSGVYAFEYPALARALSTLSARNAQGEYYLTDTVAVLAQGSGAAVVCAADHRELLGINTVEQLAEAERVHRELGGAGGR